MALKTKPEQITAEDHKLVRQFIKDSKAAGFDPTLTTIILNKTRSDKSGKAAKLVANTQRKVNKKRPAVDPARAARSAEARRQAKRAGREAKAIKDEGGFLTNEEWLKMIAQMGVTVAGGGVALAAKGAASAAAPLLLKAGQALPKMLKGAPKLLKARPGIKGPKPKSLPRGGPKQLPAGRAPKVSGPLRTSPGRPLGSPKQLADKTAWVARQEAAKKVMKDAAAKVVPKVKQMMGKGTPKAAPKLRGKPAFRSKAPVPATAAPAFGKEAAARMNSEILAKVAKNPNAPALKNILGKGLDSKNLKEVHRYVTSPSKNANWSPSSKLTPGAYDFVETMMKLPK